MSRLGSWLRGSTPRASVNPSPAGSQVDLMAAEMAQIEDAMASASKIMNDDIEGAEAGLRKGDSVFHSLGMGLTTFMKSVLGFEKDIMTEASNRLNDCETAAWNEMKKAQKEAAANGSGASQIYPPGTEFALINAEAQLMGAVVAVLYESLTEGIRGFYKLRKAFVTLDGIMTAEAEFLKRRGMQSNQTQDQLPPALKPVEKTTRILDEGDKPEDSDMEFVDAPEALSGTHTPAPQYQGHLQKQAGAEEKMAELSINSEKTQTPSPKSSPPPHQFDHGSDSDIFSSPIDVFIHSGVSMCFGILLLLISMVPPAFSRLLSVIGFKGDRERGIKILWQSTRFDNINAAVAGLMLLGFYNGLLGFADILPSDEDVENGAIVGYPRRRCAELLLKMRTTYPDSRLWRLEEARALSNTRDLHGAIKILTSNTDSPMRQTKALNNFELSLDTMFVQDYPAMRDHFLACIELSDWSHAFYYFLAGVAEVEIYRNAYHSTTNDEAQIQRHKKRAEELIRKASTVAGKKKLMARPLPFDQFFTRKVQKWEERSKELKIDFVDAVGTSTVQEMVYLLNGYKKMGSPELELASRSLNWHRLTAPEEASKKIQAEKDESAVMDVCLSAIYRALGRTDEARALLEGVVTIDKLVFKGPTKDDYALPSAHYEMAAVAWAEVQHQRLQLKISGITRDSVEGKDADAQLMKKTAECHDWLDKVVKWEGFVLDIRIGMRVQTGMDTLKWFRREQGWAAI
ncbi:breast cancer protein [Pseudomassariella vexata]|uniref:Inclusion body clearance protein IML2 n=1 Tax=Pseudomassariella vexata TaxID=1141098 RepID=A0A1Y2DUS8_9PEZI|nr:breast cancer protein [Pseudomassariella vexata]ORY62405.1 breast cancer protein [Pseudomassariella vexata]